MGYNLRGSTFRSYCAYRYIHLPHLLHLSVLGTAIFCGESATPERSEQEGKSVWLVVIPIPSG